jgi:hypothetical protein
LFKNIFNELADRIFDFGQAMNKPAFAKAVDQAVEETEIEQVYNELARVRGELEVEKLKSDRLRWG